MAIEENDRENLLRDAKMMPVRGETQIDGHTIVIGFRSDSQASLYCDADPVFQFNANNQLRRVYFHGERYAAEQGVLIKLTRESQGGKVVFHREPAGHRQSEWSRAHLRHVAVGAGSCLLSSCKRMRVVARSVRQLACWC